MVVERLYEVSIVYGIIGAAVTIATVFCPLFASVALIIDIIGIAILIWEIYGPTISMKFVRYYDDFKEGFKEDLWYLRYPVYTVRRDPDAVWLETRPDIRNHILEIRVLKRDVGLRGPLKWEGPEIVAKRKGYNLIMAKIALNFEESTAKKGNIYLSGRSSSGRFLYLMGIDKSSREVFFHIWDKEERASYGPPEVGSYIKERGRTHLKDYLKGPGEKWLILGIEWSFKEGPKFFAFKEGEKNFIKIPANPPPELRDAILKDSRNIYLYGLHEFSIRIDLVADSKVRKSIKGAVDYVKVKTAPLYLIISILTFLREMQRRILTLRKLYKKAL